MNSLNCENCCLASGISSLPAVNHAGRCPHGNAASTARVTIEEPVLMTGISLIEVQAAAATEGTICIITDVPTSVISQRIRCLLESGKTMPKEVQIITRSDETAYQLNKKLSTISICSMQSFCRDAVRGPVSAAGVTLHHILSSSLSKLLFNSALRELQIDYPPEEQLLRLDELLALKQEQDYSALILSGQFQSLDNDRREYRILKKYLELQHRYGILDYDDILMILWNACSPVPVKYLFVEDAASYSYLELLLIRRFGRNITFLQYPRQEVIGHDPEQFSEIFPSCTELTFTTTQFQR